MNDPVTSHRLAQFASMTVLIVDDHPENILLLTAILAKAGLEKIVSTHDPRQVEHLLVETSPDLILLDLHMPHLDGLDILAQVMRFASGSYLPVLMLTADTSTHARNRALEQGARDFLTMPLDTREVVLRVANLLETRHLYSLLRQTDAREDTSMLSTASTQSIRHRIQNVLRERSITPVFQPVIDIRTGVVVGYEALARFDDTHPRGIAGWFHDAFAVGLGTELEWLAVNNALNFLDTAPKDTFLALNMSPATVQLLPHRQLCETTRERQIVIELTEHVPIEDYSAIHHALAKIRTGGARLAADDLGSGYAGFRHLIALQPDIIKLDMSLVRGIHRSRAQRALARALVSFAGDVHAQVIAEGVEEAAELSVLVDIGVPWAQGYFLGKPGPAPQFSRPDPSASQ